LWRLDDLDHKLLALLMENGRESFASLGQRVGLSTAATKRRVDRLRREDVIRRFTAEVEPAALGWTIEAFVELYCEGRVPPDRMRELVRTIPEVVEAYTVTGEADGILRVRASDTADFEKILGIIRNHPGVLRTRSALVLSRL
jgi:DNA-binding Lrp family transcriptional regulator